MFSLHCTSCNAVYLMGVSAIAAALSSGSAIETASGTVVDVLCPLGHANTTGFNARIATGREVRLETGLEQPVVDRVRAVRGAAARLAV